MKFCFLRFSERHRRSWRKMIPDSPWFLDVIFATKALRISKVCNLWSVESPSTGRRKAHDSWHRDCGSTPSSLDISAMEHRIWINNSYMFCVNLGKCGRWFLGVEFYLSPVSLSVAHGVPICQAVFQDGFVVGSWICIWFLYGSTRIAGSLISSKIHL